MIFFYSLYRIWPCRYQPDGVLCALLCCLSRCRTDFRPKGSVFFGYGLGLLLSLCASSVQAQGIVINELMVNPTNGSLPAYEWIELHNASGETISLSGYTLVYNDRGYPLPQTSISGYQYLILTRVGGEDSFRRFGNVEAMALPTLNNTSADLRLVDASGNEVDQVTYSNRWFTTTAKRRGGWSLERRDPGLSCFTALNWRESTSLEGGTPGRRNSAFERGWIKHITPVETSVAGRRVRLRFATEFGEAALVERAALSLLEAPIPLSEVEVFGSEIVLYAEVPLQEGKVYKVSLQLRLCQYSVPIDVSVLSAAADAGHTVVINEILFHPKPGGVDFVELYNPSDNSYNLRNWKLGNRMLPDEDILFRPKDYIVITTNSALVQLHYPSARMHDAIVLASLPAYPQQSGTVVVFDENGGLVDSLSYSVGMHGAFMQNPRGISLERQSAEVGTNEPGNFTSSASIGEGATPGYANSKDVENKSEQNIFFLTSKVVQFTFGGDANAAFCRYHFSHPDMMINVTIFDERGRVVKRLIRERNADFSGEVYWDGSSDTGALVAGGHYIVLAELYDSEGHRAQFKEAFVVLTPR